MEKYELLYILPAKYTEAEAKVLTDKIGGIVTAAGGTVTGTHDLGKRKLAYPIKHARNGQYILTFFESETPVIAKLNETFRLSTDILRHLILLRDPLITKIPNLSEDAEAAQIARLRHHGEQEKPTPVVEKAPIRPPAPAKEVPITMAEIDKKLDEILTEEVL
jgi:small subunit ribosomal protein S6